VALSTDRAVWISVVHYDVCVDVRSRLGSGSNEQTVDDVHLIFLVN
jgi:hypothetical protein